MPDPYDIPLVPLRDVRAIADLGLDPARAADTEAAVERRLATGRPRGLRRLTRRGTVLLGTGALVLGGTAIAATTPWSPQLGDADRGHPTVSRRPIPPDQRDALALLRRPQNDADRGPQVEQLLRLLPGREVGGIHLDSIRLLADRPEGAAVLAAARRVGTNDPGYPRTATKDQLCLLQSHRFAWRRGRRYAEPSASMKCGSVADIAAGRMMMGAQWDGRFGASGLVPDGVTQVEIPLTGGPTYPLRVRNNSYLIETAVSRGRFNPTKVRWLDARGRTVGPRRR